MSQIRAIYSEEPKFPSTDQHPDAVRYEIGGKWVDAIGGKPTQQEIDDVLIPPAKSNTGLEELDAAISALPAPQQEAFKKVRQILVGRNQ